MNTWTILGWLSRFGILGLGSFLVIHGTWYSVPVGLLVVSTGLFRRCDP